MGPCYGALESSNTSVSSSDSFGEQHVSSITTPGDCYYYAPVNDNPDPDHLYTGQVNRHEFDQSLTGPCEGYYSNYGFLDFQPMEEDNNYQYLDGGDTSGNLWNVEDIWSTNYNF